MKKSILRLSVFAILFTGATMHQSVYAQTNQSDQKQVETFIFEKETYDFGELKEGDDASAEFVFKNTGSEPIIITNVRPSCGCTTPFYSKEPVAPGENGVIHASYGTKGRPGHFNKKITVNTSAGNKDIWIKGNVQKAPVSSAPANNSMLKTK